MTLKEAKKLLKKEMVIVFHSTEPFEFDESGWIEHEKPSVLEAFRVLAKEGYYISISGHDYNMRKERLKKEYEENTKAPGSDENSIKGDLSGNESIEHCGEPIPGSPLSAVEGIKSKLKDNQNTSENPALKESASQFNDALLDEQAKKIKRLGKEIARLNKIIHKKNLKIEELGKESSRHLEGKIKMFGENVDLEQMLKDKDAVLSDVAEELRLSKIREKNLTEVGQKYMKENEELKNELDAFKVSYKRRIKEDSEHFEHIQKICNVGLQKWLLESEYLEKDKPFRFSNYDIARGKENKKPRISTPEEPKHDNGREDFIKKAIDSFNIRAANLGSVGSKDGNGIIDQMIGVDIAEEGGDHSAIIVQCYKDITTISKDEAEIIERCTKNGTELHYSEKDGFTYTNVLGDEMPIIYLRGMFQVFTDEEIKNMKK